MSEIPTFDEMIVHYKDIPQERFLAWWRDKGVEWDKALDDKVYCLFMTLLTASLSDLVSKFKYIFSLSVLTEEQLDELLKLENNRTVLVSEKNNIDAEVILYFFLEVPIEDRSDTYNIIKEFYELKSQADKDQNDYDFAREKYRQALSLLKKPPLQKYGWLDFYRADIAGDIGTIEIKACNYSSAVNDYEKSLHFYESYFCFNRPELAPNRAGVAMNLGVAHRNLGQYNEAAKNYKKAEEIYEGEYCFNRPELAPERARVAMNLGVAHRNLGQYNEAVASYEKAETIHAGKYCSSRPELAPERARVAMNLGVVYRNLEQYTEAITSYKKAEGIYGGVYCSNRPELDPSRARVAINLGNAYNNLGQYTEAVESYKKAEEIHAGEYCSNRPELDPSRARVAINLGNAHRKLEEYTKAVASYKKAEEIHEGEYCINHFELAPDRASVAMNLGVVYYDLEDYIKAVASYKKAERIYEGDSFGHWLPLLKDRCVFYANFSDLLSEMESPFLWAKDKSQRMANFIELLPDIEGEGENASLWKSMREEFIRFHLNWLEFSIKSKSYDQISIILFAIQGREVAAEVLEQLVDDSTLESEHIKEYLKLRSQLRKMVERQGRTSGHSKPFNPDKRAGGIENDAQREARLTAEAEARKEYNRLYQEMVLVRGLAAKEPGYEVLQLSYDQFSSEQIKNKLDNHQALVLAIDFKEVEGILLLFKEREPVWLPLTGLAKRAGETEKLVSFNVRQGSGQLYRRNLSRGEEKPVIKFSPEECNSFWPQQIKENRQQFWEPLLTNLEGITELFILPQGRLHQFPFEAGKPEGVNLLFYPGLIFWAFAHGLLEQKRREDTVTSSYDVALLYDKNTDLDGVKKEAETICATYQDSPALTLETLDSPKPYPTESLHINLLSFCGHGEDDPQNPYSTVMVTGNNGKLGSPHIVSGKSRVEYAFINSCTTGKIRENVYGTPLGLVSGYMRRHSKAVAAALQPISDYWASCFSGIFHSLWKDELLKGNQPELSAVITQTKIEFRRQVGNILKQEWLQILIAHALENRTLQPDMLENLRIIFLLNEEDVERIRKISARDKGEEEYAAEIINTLDSMNRFTVDENHCLPDIGVILYLMRVYGR